MERKYNVARQAIETKYLGPTDTKGSRVKATAAMGESLTVSWDYGAGNDTGESDVSANHRAAGMKLVEKLGWGGHGDWVLGSTKNGYVLVCSV